MTSFGVLSTGFSIKTLSDLLSEIEASEKATLGAGLNTTSTSVLGQFNGIMADRLSELWQVAQALYASQYAESASGASLDLVLGLLGLVRLSEARSKTNLSLNLGAGNTLPAGSRVSSSTTGSVFSTDVAVTNGTIYPANVTVAASAILVGPIIVNPRSLDTIDSPSAGWDPSVAINSVNAEPYAIIAGDTLILKVDSGSPQTVTFLAGDTTAALVSTRINALTSGVFAQDVGGFVRLTSESDEPGNAIEATGGSAFPMLGFPAGFFSGFNPQAIAAQTITQNTAPYALSGTETLNVIVDGGAPQTITFQAADFAVSGVATPIEVARRINTDIAGGTAVELTSNLVIIRSSNNLSTSSIQVTGGSANLVLNFPTDAPLRATVVDSASIGRYEETDSEARIRRSQALAPTGSRTLGSIRSALLAVSGVSQVQVLENSTNATVGSLPAHSFNAIVQGGDDQDIRDAILSRKGEGIQSYGTTTGFALDSEGNSYEIDFSRPGIVDLYINTTLEFVSAEYPIDGDDQVSQAMISIVRSLVIGKDVVTLPIKSSALNIAGVRNVSVFFIGTAPSPVSDPGKIVIGSSQLAQLQATNISIIKTNYMDI